MITIHKRIAIILLAIFLTIEFVSAANAQTTVLTGQVPRIAVPVPATPQVQYGQSVSTVPLTGSATLERPKPKVTPMVTKVYLRDNRTYWQRHPMVKSAAIGAGVGAAGGAVIGAISGRGIVRGAVIGAGTGAGVGVVRASKTLKRHPIIRDVATGSLVGLGIGGAASRRCGWATGLGIGAAVGLGVGVLKHGL